LSRLYAWVESDTRKTELTTGGDELVEVQVNLGSRDDSRVAATLSVRWPRGAERPEIRFDNHVEEG